MNVFKSELIILFPANAIMGKIHKYLWILCSGNHLRQLIAFQPHVALTHDYNVALTQGLQWK